MPRAKGQTAAPGTGKHYKPHPLDYAIIERLPNEGAMLGYHNIAMPVIALHKELNQGVPLEGQVTTQQISGRMMSMNYAGLVVQAVGLSSEKMGWQRTPKGVKHYEASTGRKLPKNGKPKPTLVEPGRTYYEGHPSLGQTEEGGN